VAPAGKPATEAKPAAPQQKSTAESASPAEAPPGERFVTIDFDDVDIQVFIKFISELTGKNFVIDKAVRGNVTIVSPTKISVDEAYKVFESVLEVNGLSTVPSGSVIKIVPAADARTKDIETRLRMEAAEREDRIITQIIPLRYADPVEIQRLFRPLISKSSVMVPYVPTGMLIVTDVQSNINRLLAIIESIDVEGVGEEISIFPLQYASADIMATSLNTLFQRRVRGGKGAAEPAIKIVADERTNSLVTLASEDETLKIKQLIALLDRKTPRGEGDIRVYYLQNANAEDLSKVLMAIPSEPAKGEAKGQAPIISKNVQIVPDKATNSLVITASRADYLVLEDVIKKLDIPRRMVYLEALLVEVSVNKNFALGVQWQAAEQVGSTEGKALYGFSQSIPPQSELAQIGPLSTGFAVGVLGETIEIGGVEFASLTAVIRALETESGVNILSTPQILALDNEEAEIVVAENIPYLTREGRTPADVDYNQYEFRDVGVTLNITPQINQERYVRLVLSQEVAQVVDQEEIGLPSTLKRSAKTTVVVEDGQTVVIGGLIDETLNQTEYRVPCLGNIPYVGWAFKTRASSGDRTNLYFFVTPRIIETPVEMKTVYEEKWDQIDQRKQESVKMYRKPWEKDPALPTK